jgi:hypothetical protein
MKILLSILFTLTLICSTASLTVFAEGNNNNEQMGTNDDGNYGEGPMNINEDDGPLRINDEDGVGNRDGRARVTATGAEDDTNWEWIGILGLAGLLGLRKRDSEPAR